MADPLPPLDVIAGAAVRDRANLFVLGCYDVALRSTRTKPWRFRWCMLRSDRDICAAILGSLSSALAPRAAWSGPRVTRGSRG